MAAPTTLPQGITKDITRHPPTHRYLSPQLGDEVEVHYGIFLSKDGRQVDSSKERGEALVCKVGDGRVMEALDRGLQTMKKGEHAKFVVEARHAYGEAGSEALKVPPDSAVILEVELVKCPLREDLFGDGGAVKLEVKDCPNARMPRVGDECTVSYKVTVEGDGVAMASQHVVYKIGSEQMGQVAQVIDKALSGMKRGDEARITCQPSYAYGTGEGKYAGKVATVFVALEEIFEVHDVSLGALDQTVLRKRIKEGDEGTDKVHSGSRVKLELKSVLAKGEMLFSGSWELSFTAGEGEMCDAVEGCVLGMRLKDEAIIRCMSPEACAGGLMELPAGIEKPVMIHIVVLGFSKVKEKWDLASSERVESGAVRKELATRLFKAGRIRLAAHHYEAVADLFLKLEFFKAEEQPRAAELRRVANLNRAMCLLKTGGSMMLVKDLCTGVLSEDALNPKALFRRAKARLALKEHAEAVSDLQRLLEVEPGSAEGKQLLREATRLLKQNDQKDSRVFAKMCAGLGQLPEPVTNPDAGKVTMPNLEEEYAKFSQQAGVSAPARLVKASGPVVEEVLPEPEQAESTQVDGDMGGPPSVGQQAFAPPDRPAVQPEEGRLG